MACHRAGSRAHTETAVSVPCSPGSAGVELLLLGPAGSVPGRPAKGTGTEMGTRWAEGSPELWGGDRDLRDDRSRAMPCRAVPCRVPTRAPMPTVCSSAVAHPDSRSRPCRASALSPRRGRRRGGQRDPCCVSLWGAPGPAPQCGPCSASALSVPVKVCSGARLSPAGGKGQAEGHINSACHPPALELCPQFLGSRPQTPSPPPPPGLALPMATSPGTRAGDTVTLPGYFGEDKSGRRQVRGRGSRRRGGE